MEKTELYVLADVDYEDFTIVGIYSTMEKAKERAALSTPDGRAYWIETFVVDDGGRKMPYFRSTDGKTWDQRG